MRLMTIAVPTKHGIVVQDALDWNGKLWIATFWINAGHGWHRPSRLIRFDNIPHSTGEHTDYQLREPLPDGLHTSGLFGQNADGVEQIDYPPVLIPGALIDAQRKKRLFQAAAA